VPARLPIPKLLRWYRRHRRAMPWRPTADRPANPYHVLVSEAMLQQTQVATVIPYFERFVAEFPTVEALAAAEEQKVLTLWQGLGYYRRARNLHAAAKTVVADHGARVPDDAATLLTLPGVGRYTAGAVASVAYDTPAPIVDGNVARVYARFYGLTNAVDRPDTLKTLWSLAEANVAATTSPRDFNQSVMELGALVCTPKSPGCLTCPLRDNCSALASGDVDRLPIKTPKKKPVAVTHRVLALYRSTRRGDRYLFERRPADGLWSRMWQLPTDETGGRDLAAERGLEAAEPEPVTTFVHPTTHRTVRFEVRRARVTGGRLKPKMGVWRPLGAITELPLAKPQQQAVARLAESA